LPFVPALFERQDVRPRRTGRKLGCDPERRPPSPLRLEEFEGARRPAEKGLDLGGVGFEGNQDAQAPARTGDFRGKEKGARTGEGRTGRGRGVARYGSGRRRGGF
jgi:hypothetical protein